MSKSVVIFFAVVTALYVGTIGALPLLGKDEPRYVEVAREMFARGDWVTPILGNHTWFEKPALLYWMIMASFHLFGVSEWAARLGPALCALITVVFIFWMARRVEAASDNDSNTHGIALWSAAAMASSIGLIAFAHAATFDIVLTATITIALCCFFMAELESDSRKRRRLLAGLWIGVGLSVMAKGLVGFILPGGVIALYFAMRRDWRGFARLKVLWGLPLSLAVAALWYAPVIARHGEVFINEFFVQHHFARYLSNKYQHHQPVYYYLPVMASLALPWTAFLLSAVCEAKSATWSAEDSEGKLRVFALSWLIVPVAFFSLSGSKLPGYVLPALPGAMLLAGLSVDAYVRGIGGLGATRLTGILLVTLGIALAVYAKRSGTMTMVAIGAVSGPMLGAGLVAATMASRRALCAGLIVGAMLFSTGVLTAVAGVPVGESKSVRTLIRAADARGYNREPVWQMNTLQRTAEFYAAGRLLYDDKGEPKEFQDVAQVAQALPAGSAALVLAPLKQARSVSQTPLLKTESIGDNGNVALLRVRRSGGINEKS